MSGCYDSPMDINHSMSTLIVGILIELNCLTKT